MKQKYKNLLNDTIIFAIGNIGSKMILFFLVPLYTNILSAEEYGTAELVFTVAQLLIPFVSVVIFDAVLRFGLSKHEKSEDILVTSFIVMGIESIVTVVLMPALKLYIRIAAWRWYLCIHVILSMYVNVQMNYLKVKEKNKAYAMVSIVHTAAMALLNILFLVVFGWGVKGYLLASIGGNVVTAILVYIVGNMNTALAIGRFDKDLAKRMVMFSAPLILNNVSWWVIQSSDKVMIELMVGAAALGLYTVATKIPSFINVIISVFSQAWGVSSVKEIEADNDKQFYADVFNVYSVITFGASVALVSITKPFMNIYVGEAFVDAWRYVPLLLASASFSAIASYFGSLYGALKMSVRNMTSTLTAAVINIVINYVGVLYLGIWGALIGTIVAYVVLALFRMVDVLRYIRFDPKWPVFLGNVVIVLGQAIAVSLDFHIVISSIIATVAFVVINYTTLYQLFKRVVRGK